MPLSKSAFTVMSLCISTFSIPISSHTSLNILNVLLTSLCLSLSLAISFRVSIHILPYYAFPSVGHATSLQFYYSLFLSILHSGYKILLLSCFDISLTTIFLLPHFAHSILIISSLFASFFLQFYASWYRLYYTFLTCFSRRNSCP